MCSYRSKAADVVRVPFAPDAQQLKDLNIAAEANMLTHVSWLPARIDGMSVRSDPQLTIVDSGLQTDTFNFVCRARIGHDEVQERISGVVDHFRTVGRPFSWWVGPADRPVTLGAELLRTGFTAADGELAMAADLGNIAAYSRTPGGVQIERAATAEQVHHFAEIVAANWTPPDAAVLRYFELATSLLLLNECPLRLYLAYLNKEPVGVAEITLSGSAAGVYNVSTRLAHRHKGIGTAVLLHALQDARSEGYNYAVLQAARGAESIYAGIGFVPTGEYVEYKI